MTGHAWLKTPLARNGDGRGTTSCPHCGQGDGPATVKPRSNDQWPTHHAYGGHGLCGDPFQGTDTKSYADERFLNLETEAAATYSAGQKVKFEVYISTHHNGHYEFRLCDQVINPTNFATAKDGQDCLDQYLLERVNPDDQYGDCTANDARADCQPMDPKHPERWYLPPRTQAGNIMEMWYWLPAGVTCEKCTLQWYWSTGNTCLYDGDYVDYFMGTFPNAGWTGANSWSQFGSQSWGKNQVCGAAVFAEEFWNCADIKIGAGGGGGGGGQHRRRQAPVAPPTPAPSPAPTAGAGGGLAAKCRASCGKRQGDWKSDFTEFEGNNAFCSCGFGGSCGFICSGAGASGGQCPAKACTDGTYTFKDNTWKVTMTKAVAAGKNPYRAFAYLPLCQHKATRGCLSSKEKSDKAFTLAFSFRTTSVVDWGAYVKLIFWTDGGNLVGLIPPSIHKEESKKNKIALVTFPQDDYPNAWTDKVYIEDNTWYSVKIKFEESGKTTIKVAGTGLVSKNENYGVNVMSENNGPQLGFYHFDIQNRGEYRNSVKSISVELAALSGPGGNVDRHDCEHGCLASAAPAGPSPQPSPAPSTNSCKGCLTSSSDWKGKCAWSRCAGCKGCPTKTKCETWCPDAPPQWSEKCGWIYCEGCSSCKKSTPTRRRAQVPSPTPAPTPPPGPTFCCGWGECSNCESHNRQDSSTWCGASQSQCTTCNGKWCER